MFKFLLVESNLLLEATARLKADHDFYYGTSLAPEILGDGKALLITTRGSTIRLAGDLNYDGKVNVQDVLLLVDYNLGNEGLVNEYFGDINGDGLVNVMDMVALIRMVLGYQ